MNSSSVSQGEQAPANPMMVVLEGVARRRCIGGTYNRQRMILAPHIVYTRNGAFYLDAVVVSREAMIPREVKLGTFKIDGLTDLRVTPREFDINAVFEPEAEKYEGVTFMKVEPESAEAA